MGGNIISNCYTWNSHEIFGKKNCVEYEKKKKRKI